MQRLVESFVSTANAVIDDVSVGDAFVGTDGVRQYLERFFVGYSTKAGCCLA